jgi:xanthine dehydrogenase YagT iron-sulfur-binding subunit
VNGAERSVTCEPDTPLLDVLRHELGLAGPKFGCGMGLCGACLVLVEGRASTSCDLPVSAVSGPVTTVEGLPGGDGRLHPVQQAFIAHDGLQCGFCTPGQIMSAIGLIQEGQTGDDPERIREAMSGNLCRCGAYRGITEAVLEAHNTLDAASRKEIA